MVSLGPVEKTGCVEIRRVRSGEGDELRGLRLRALADAPGAFASTYADEASRPPEVWEEAARRRSQGEQESTFVAVDGRRWVGLVGADLGQADATAVELVSLWTAPAPAAPFASLQGRGPHGPRL